MQSHIRIVRLFRLVRPSALSGGVLIAGLSLMVGTAALSGGFQSNRSPDQPSQQKQEPPTYAVPAARMPVAGDEFHEITTELINSEMRVKESMQYAETMQSTLSRARTRRYPRGAALEDLRAKVTQAASERDTAQNNFLQLVETARRAGVPNGTLVRYLDLADLVRQDQQRRAQSDANR
jgi:hypothetical protein